jgi:hypothetical protein
MHMRQLQSHPPHGSEASREAASTDCNTKQHVPRDVCLLSGHASNRLLKKYSLDWLDGVPIFLLNVCRVSLQQSSPSSCLCSCWEPLWQLLAACHSCCCQSACSKHPTTAQQQGPSSKTARMQGVPQQQQHQCNPQEQSRVAVAASAGAAYAVLFQMLSTRVQNTSTAPQQQQYRQQYRTLRCITARLWVPAAAAYTVL